MDGIASGSDKPNICANVVDGACGGGGGARFGDVRFLPVVRLRNLFGVVFVRAPALANMTTEILPWWGAHGGCYSVGACGDGRGFCYAQVTCCFSVGG